MQDRERRRQFRPPRYACIRTRIRNARCYDPEPWWPVPRPGGSSPPDVAPRRIYVRSSSSRRALFDTSTRRARLFEEACLSGQHPIQVIEVVENPQGLDPGADLNRARTMLHRTDRSCTDSEALREHGHGVVTCKTQSLQAVPEFQQVSMLFLKVHSTAHKASKTPVICTIAEIRCWFPAGAITPRRLELRAHRHEKHAWRDGIRRITA